MKYKVIITVSILVLILGIHGRSYNSGRTYRRQNSSRSCSITLPSDIPENEPVYLLRRRNSYRLYRPVNKTNTLTINSKITLFCPGRANSVVNGQGNMTEISCKGRNQFESETTNDVLDFQQLNCTKPVYSEIRLTRDRCAKNNGYLFEVGFNVNPGNFLRVFSICFDNRTESTFYTTHTIHGSTIRHSVKEDRRPNFRTNGMPRGTEAGTCYNKRNQIARINEILGNGQNFVNSTNYLSRGHLTPDADFEFPSHQFATYYYMNVAPEFQSVNGGNWKRIENMARDLAGDYNHDLLVYTGVYDILLLPDQYGDNIPIYLADNSKIRVPKWFWKAIIDEKSDAAIVMITLNNPFAHRSSVSEFCTNVCSEAALTSRNFSIMRKGYTFCCELNEFKNVVENVLPSNLTASNLLSCAHISHLVDQEINGA